MSDQTDRVPARRPPHRWLLMGSLILAGESIYMLPYLRKSFQTSMEATFGLTGLEVGTLNALFGILALACYLPGGWLADRFPARHLLTISLVATSIGGFYMATLPGYSGLLLVHAFWGIFAILTFWAALIKATRLLSEPSAQGRAFGVLDGGRGVVGAGLGSIAALCFGLSASVQSGLVAVIIVYSLAALVAGIAVWLVVPDDPEPSRGTAPARPTGEVLRSIGSVIRLPEVWLIALVIFCAYATFLGTYEFPAYAERGFERSKEFGAWLGAYRDWLRPVAAIGAGIIADRVSTSRAIAVAFGVLVLAYGTLAVLPADAAYIGVLWAQVAATALAVFALRGIYFALLEEARIPMQLTGIAVGFVSMVAYTPDILAPLVSGGLVDASPGTLGYRYFFGLMTAASTVGLIAILVLRRRIGMRAESADPISGG